MTDKFFDYDIAFARNLGLISTAEQRLLRARRVAIPGCGGVGGIHALCLARTGIGSFNLADFDQFELANFNRQFGAKTSTLGQKKVSVIAKEILEINPTSQINTWDSRIDSDNIKEFLTGVDVVVDSLDFFAFDHRAILYETASKMGIPIVTAAPMGFSCGLLVFAPGGMSFQNYFQIMATDPPTTKAIKFAMGLAPKGLHLGYLDPTSVDLEAQKGPSSGIAVTLCASVATATATRIMLGRVDPLKLCVPRFLQFDPYRLKFRRGYLWRGNRNPWQRFKMLVASLLIIKRGQRRRASATWGDDKGNSPEEVMHRIARAGQQAPSGDNCQPFKIVISKNHFELIHEPARAAHALNYANVASILTLGACLENMRIAAGEFGLKTKETLFLSPDRVLSKHPTIWAHVDIAADDRITRDALANVVFARHVDRRKYCKDENAVQKISQIVENHPPFNRARARFAPGMTSELCEAIVALEASVWTSRSAHQDLMRWIRFPSRRPVSRDGMPAWTLGLSGLEILGLWFCQNYFVQKVVNPVFLPGLRKKILENLKSSAGLVLLTSDSYDYSNVVDCGRSAQRLWLSLNASGIAVQPLSLLPFGLCALETGHAHLLHRRGLEAVLARGALALEKNFRSSGAKPVWLFRVGRPLPIHSQMLSPRLPVSDERTRPSALES